MRLLQRMFQQSRRRTRNVVTHPNLKRMNHILSQESQIGVEL